MDVLSLIWDQLMCMELGSIWSGPICINEGPIHKNRSPSFLSIMTKDVTTSCQGRDNLGTRQLPIAILEKLKQG